MNLEQLYKEMEATFKECYEIVKAKNKYYAKSKDPFKNFRITPTVRKKRTVH